MLSVSSVFQAEHLDSAAAAPSDCQHGGLLCLLHARYVPALLARASGYCTGFVRALLPVSAPHGSFAAVGRGTPGRGSGWPGC